MNAFQTGTINEVGFPSAILSVSADSIKLENGLYYEITDGKAEITGCDENVTEIIVPPEIDGCPVTSIGDYSFYCCTELLSVKISDSVASIGDGAFKYCDKNLAIYGYVGSYAAKNNIPFIALKEKQESGDINGNGQIDILDLSMLKQYLMDLLVLDLVDKGFVTDQMVLTVGYDIESDTSRYKG